MDKETLGDVIRNRRMELGWTQEELADHVADLGDPIRQSDISRLERNETALPRRARLECIAEALDLPLGELLERSGWSGALVVFEEQEHEITSTARGEVSGVDWSVAPYPVSRLDRHDETADGYRRLQQALGQAYEHQRRLRHNREKVIETERRFTELVRRDDS